MYDIENTSHYDYFDYLDDDGNIMQYEPDSDMEFISFKNQMKEEWNNREIKWYNYITYNKPLKI